MLAFVKLTSADGRPDRSAAQKIAIGTLVIALAALLTLLLRSGRRNQF